jgi:hypothetical protein
MLRLMLDWLSSSLKDFIDRDTFKSHCNKASYALFSSLFRIFICHKNKKQLYSNKVLKQTPTQNNFPLKGREKSLLCWGSDEETIG